MHIKNYWAVDHDLFAIERLVTEMKNHYWVGALVFY